MFQCLSSWAEDRENIIEQRNYLLIDYVWRYEMASYPYSQHILLAVEHENKGDSDSFLGKEVQHLIDVKADYKVAITYPSLGEETELIRKIRERIGSYTRKLSTKEQYLIVFGFTTRKKKKGAIRFNAYFIDAQGELLKRKERVIYQRSRSVKPMESSRRIKID